MRASTTTTKTPHQNAAYQSVRDYLTKLRRTNIEIDINKLIWATFHKHPASRRFLKRTILHLADELHWTLQADNTLIYTKEKRQSQHKNRASGSARPR